MTSKLGSLFQNAQYLAQVGHFFGSLSVMLVYGIFTREWYMLFAFIVGVLLAAAKEFIYDVNPKWGEGDSWSDSAMDFSFYVFGGTVGMWLAHLAIYRICVGVQ